MKKIILTAIASLFLITPASAYVVKNGDTLSKIAIQYHTTVTRLVVANHIENPNIIRVGQPLLTDSILGALLPTAPADVDNYLVSGIGVSDTSMSLSKGTSRGGTSFSGYMCFTLDVNTPQLEYTCGTASGTAVTGLQRGIDDLNPNTTSSALAFVHRRLASAQVTDFPVLQFVVRKLNGLDTLDNFLTMTTSTVLPTSSGQLATKYYVDQVGAGGFTASNVSTTRGLSVDGSSPERVGINASSTTGVAFDNAGRLYQKIDTATGIQYSSGSAGIGINTSTVVSLIATATPVAGHIPLGATSTGKLDGATWISGPLTDGANSNANALHYHPNVIFSTSSVVTAANSANTTTLYTFTIPANTVVTSSVLEILMPFDVTASGADGMSLMLVAGNTRLTTSTIATANFNGTSGVYRAYIEVPTSTIVQRNFQNYAFGTTTSSLYTAFSNTMTAIDYSSSQTITVAARSALGATGAGINFNADGLMVRINRQ